MTHDMVQIGGRRRCVLCCRLCFTANAEPTIKERSNYHDPCDEGRSKRGGKSEITKGRGRIGHYANHECSVCKVPLCTKKCRFPNVRKTCWELWHSEHDLEDGLCQTLCHIRNPREDLGIPTTTQTATTAPAIEAGNAKRKRNLMSIGYGVKPVRKSKRD